MASYPFITRVKTHLNITHNSFDAKLSDLVDEALAVINRFKETAVDEDTIDFLDRRAIYMYVAIQLDNRSDLDDAWKQQIELVRDK